MKELYTALVNLQADLKPVAKSASNPFFKSKYAPLPEVMETIQPLLAKHKLAVMQLMDNLNGEPALTTIIAHESGEEIRSTSPLLLTKNDPQAHGSAVTYARRYGLMSALGLVADEDDDGNKASVVSRTVGKQKWTPSTTKPASDQQREFIANLMRQHGIAKEDMKFTLMGRWGINGELTQADAQMVIDDLNVKQPA